MSETRVRVAREDSPMDTAIGLLLVVISIAEIVAIVRLVSANLGLKS